MTSAREFAEQRKQLPPDAQGVEQERDQRVKEALAYAEAKGKESLTDFQGLATASNQRAEQHVADIEQVYETLARKLQTTPVHALDMPEVKNTLRQLDREYSRAQLLLESAEQNEAAAEVVAADPAGYYEDLMRRYPTADDRLWVW